MMIYRLSYDSKQFLCHMTIYISSSSSAIVSPLLNEGLSQLLPQLPILSYSLPGYSCKFFDLVPPSCIWSFSTLFLVIRMPVGQSFRPSIIDHPSYMSCPPPFLLFNYLYNVFYFSFFSNPGRSFPI